MIVMTWSAVVGTVAALCTTLSFLPQLLKVRRQGGASLSMAMLTLLLAGHCCGSPTASINDARPSSPRTSRSIVLVSAIVDHEDPRRIAGRSRRRLRIAIDMDEVMADALTEHLRRYNAAFGTQLPWRTERPVHLEQCIPAAHREAAEAMLDASFFARPRPACPIVRT